MNLLVFRKIIYLLFSPSSVAIFVYLFFQLQVYNLTLSLLDEGFIFYNAQQILQGKIPYKDFFLTTTPGSYYFLALFLKLLGNYLVIARYLNIFFDVALLLTVSSIFNLTKSWKYFYLLTLAFLSIHPGGFMGYNNAIHISLAALLCIIKGYRSNKLIFIILAGILSGLSFIFKQSVGGLVIPSFFLVLLFYFKKENRNSFVFYYLLSSIIPIAAFLTYFYTYTALTQFIYYTYTFAQSVKSHQSSFLVHRIIFIPIFLVSFRLFSVLSVRKKIIFASLIFTTSIYYLLSHPPRIGRLVDYLLDPTFYLYSIIFILPLIVIGFSTQFNKRSDYFYTIVSFAVLALFLSIAASGYSFGVLFAVTPVFFPLIIYISDILEKKYIVLKKIPSILLIIFITTCTINLAFNPFSNYIAQSEKYPRSTFTKRLDIQEAKGIMFPEQESKDLLLTINYIKTHTKTNEKIFCFPYCPMMYILTQRDSASFYTLFFFETFMQNDQEKVIKELVKNNTKYILMQKTGDLENRQTLEEERLSTIVGFIKSHYAPVLKTDNFDIYQKQLLKNSQL